MDILAWSILAVFYIVAIVPFLGGAFDHHQSYTESFMLGFVFHITILIIVTMAYGLFWALIRVTA